MIEMINRNQLRLEVQLSLVLDCPSPFITTTYFFEGDSELVFFAMDKLEELKRHGELLLGGEMPKVQALILQQDPQRLDYWESYAFDCATCHQLFQQVSKFIDELKEVI